MHLCGHVFGVVTVVVSVERVSLIAGILKISGIVIFLYGEKYYVIMHQAYLMKNCHNYAFGCTKRTFII